MHATKVIFIAGSMALVGAAAGGRTLYVRNAHGRSAAGEPREDAPGAAGGSAVAPLGQQRRFALHLDMQLEQPGHQEPLAVSLEGEWATTLTAVRPDERDIACEVVHPVVSGRGVAQASPADVAALAQRLAQRFWVTYRSDGTALRVHFPRTLTATDRNLLQLIVTATELVRPASAATSWTAVERDSAGTYLAVYLRSMEHPGEIVKRKLKYVEADGVGEPARSVPVELTASEWRFSVDAAGELSALDGADQLRIATPMAPPGSTRETPGSHLVMRAAVRLRGVRTVSAPELVGGLERARGLVDSGVVGTSSVDREQAIATRDARLLEGHTGQALLAAASAPSDDQVLPARLAALFRRHPDTIPAGIELVRQRGGRSLVTDALATAGTPPALGALGALARDPAAPRRARMDALNALIRVPRPGAAELRVATDLLDDPDPEVRRAARMVDGALAYALRARDPVAQAEVERGLLARYPDATTSERADLLHALGNSAGPATLPAVLLALEDGHVEIRTAAVRALRRIEDEKADRTLATVIASDPDERVRIEAIRAASERWPDRPTPAAPPRGVEDPVVASLLHAATADRSDVVRAGAVGVLRRHLDAGPDIVATLATIAQRDRRPGVRHLAREWLPDGSVAPR